MQWRRAIALLLPWCGCVGDPGFRCASSAQCGSASTCEPSGYCSGADPGCASGRRYLAHAGALSLGCVELSTADLGSGDSADASCPHQPEICNGIDDDCDGTVDNGCPTDVVLTTMTTLSPQYGSTTGDTATQTFDDSCPLGQVLVGATGSTGGRLDHLGGVCGTPTLAIDKSKVPWVYSVTVGSGATLPVRGTYASTPFTLACPADTVVAAISGQATSGGAMGGGVSELHFTCSPVVISGSPGSFKIAFGGTTTAVGVDGSWSFNPFSWMGGGGGFDRLTGLAGAHIDWLKFGDRKLSLQLR